jgi:methyltransferase family protein
MACCTPNACDEFFDARVARRDAARYRRRGLDGTARRIVDQVRCRGAEGRTVLEVGGGVGAIQIELLRAGAARSVVAEASPAYEPYADALLREAGLAGRVERLVVDFAARSDEVARADVVILHRVVCCHPDHRALAGAAAAHAKALLVLTYPRDAWWTRLGVRAANRVQRLMRREFRIHLHPPADIAAAVEEQGLSPSSLHRGRIWELRSFERPSLTAA